MNRKIKVIAICLILIALALIVEIVLIKKSVKFEASVTIVTLNQDVEKFALITEDMLVYKDLKFTDLINGAVKNKEDIINKYAKTNLFKNEQLLLDRVSTDKINHGNRPDKKDKRYITLNFEPQEANGWILDRNQIVDLVYLPRGFRENENQDGKTVDLFKDVKIISILDEQLLDVTDYTVRDTIPKYISFEVNKDYAEKIIFAKNNGTVEVLVK